jgi:hypothetical protein
MAAQDDSGELADEAQFQRDVTARLQVLTDAVRRLDERLEGMSMTLEEIRLLAGGFQDDRRLP